MGALANRVGLRNLALALYERWLLRKGTHQVQMAGRLLTFRVYDRGDVTVVDWFGWGERTLMDRVLKSMREKDTVFDVGANIGLVSILLGVAGQRLGVNVHAFEANPETAERARENAALNQCTNVVVHPVALADRCGFTSLHTHRDYHGRDSMLVVEGLHTGMLKVPTETADTIARRLGVRPDIVKIDVEGAELDVLRGSEEMLGRGSVRDLFIEVHPERLATAACDEGVVVSYLRGHGYRSVWRHVRNTEIHHHFQRG